MNEPLNPGYADPWDRSIKNLITTQSEPLALPSIDHNLKGGHDAIFPHFEEVAVPSNSLKELHDHTAMWIRGDARLNEAKEHLAVSS